MVTPIWPPLASVMHIRCVIQLISFQISDPDSSRCFISIMIKSVTYIFFAIVEICNIAASDKRNVYVSRPMLKLENNNCCGRLVSKPNNNQNEGVVGEPSAVVKRRPKANVWYMDLVRGYFPTYIQYKIYIIVCAA